MPCYTQMLLTKSSISRVWDADRHILALASIIGVAGNPTTTIAILRFSISLEKTLKERERVITTNHKAIKL